jgi:trans-aconitate methyltransferase
MSEPPTAPGLFESMYQKSYDPWDFASSEYERGRYQAVMTMLQRERYRSAFEPGCSIGELTALLAPRCEELLAIDLSPTAIARARQRCSSYPNVQFEVADLEQFDPDRKFDLIVLSEIGYYFDRAHLEAILRRLASRLADDGELLSCHWLGHSADHAQHAEAVHEACLAVLPLAHNRSSLQPQYRIDTWVR